jgi:pimeloyl-ACP methyl ester carboxylesterase
MEAQRRAARAGRFDVIAPELRGFGDSGLAPDGRYDAAAHAADMAALLAALGHERAVVCAATSAASWLRTYRCDSRG